MDTAYLKKRKGRRLMRTVAETRTESAMCRKSTPLDVKGLTAVTWPLTVAPSMASKAKKGRT